MKIDILENKNRFVKLVNSITRQGFAKEELLTYLETQTDFYTAPATSQYNLSVEGGLCQHSLDTYDMLVKICNARYPDEYEQITNDDGQPEDTRVRTCPYSEDTLKIVALFHELSSVNFYEKYFMNKKVYSDTGSKHDENGKFDWVSVSAYKVKDAESRFVLGSREQNTVYMLEGFMPMSVEEVAALISQKGNMTDNPSSDVPTVYSRFNISALLHCADVLSTYTLR